MKSNNLMIRAIVCVALLLATTGPSWAYLDPGTGSLLLQSAIAAVAAVGATAGLYWARLKGLIFKARKPGKK
jgi:hypothetical protein